MICNRNYEKKITELLSEKEVELVIGWQEGSLPLTSTPIFITKKEDAEKAIFDITCQNNLTVFLTKDKRRLPKTKKKIGIVAKGCDARSLTLYLVERQVKRDNVFIIGVPCGGVIDRKKLPKAINQITEYKIDGDKVFIKGNDFDITLSKNEVLCDSCLDCRYPDAIEFDAFIGEPREMPIKKDSFAVVSEFEKKDADERWEYIKQEYSKCIRCYACRNVCPSCYCNVCFVDQNDPQWFGKTPEFTDTLIFHLIRNLHIAGRCVDCGACARACPMDIDLRILNKKVEKELLERFNYIAGLDKDEKPAMASYDENEKQEFIMG